MPQGLSGNHPVVRHGVLDVGFNATDGQIENLASRKLKPASEEYFDFGSVVGFLCLFDLINRETAGPRGIDNLIYCLAQQ
jgi:hypothetical protein